MSESLWQRRLAAFRANRRGYWSLWVFGVLFVLTLMAELIANEKPIVMEYRGELYWPVLQRYVERDVLEGGQLESEIDYRDPWVIAEITRHGWMLKPLIPFHHRTISYDIPRAPSAPDDTNWLGTDDQGRDVLARIIYGFRISVLFALGVTAGCTLLGIALGAMQGFLGGRTDLVMQRVIEVWESVPTLFLLIILSAILDPNIWILLIIMTLFGWMGLAALVRAEFLRARNFDYVRAARALGVSQGVIIVRHILPNAMVSTLTMVPFMLAGAIINLTALDFLGFGLPPGSASLGELLKQGMDNLQSVWLVTTSCLSISVILILFIFIGEAARDAFNPHKNSGGRR